MHQPLGRPLSPTLGGRGDRLLSRPARPKDRQAGALVNPDLEELGGQLEEPAGVKGCQVDTAVTVLVAETIMPVRCMKRNGVIEIERPRDILEEVMVGANGSDGKGPVRPPDSARYSRPYGDQCVTVTGFS
jgi:hypothetical protein